MRFRFYGAMALTIATAIQHMALNTQAIKLE